MTAVPKASSHFWYAAALEMFLEALRSEHNASANTCAAYSHDIIDFCNRQVGGEWLTITADHVRTYFSQLQKQGLRPATRARRLSSLRHFFKFMYGEGLITVNPTMDIDSPRLQRPLPKYLSEEEVETLLAHARQVPGPEGVRLIALLELLYATGMRVSELISLPLEASPALRSPPDLMLRIRGKGNKERYVPITPVALEALQAYHDVRPSFDSKAGQGKWLFPSRGAQGHLTRQRLGQLLKQLALDAGLDPTKISPHVMRHAFASHLIAHDVDLVSVAKMLGHASITTTQIYTHVQQARLKKVIETCHPLANMANQKEGNTE